MKKFGVIGFLLMASLVQAQDGIEMGVKAGATFTHGFTKLKARTAGTTSIPEINNKNNGIGVGYTAGLWARKNIGTNGLYLQLEVLYDRFLLKQKTDATVTAAAASVFDKNIQLSPFIPPTLPVTVNLTSESTLETIGIPLLLGKRWGDGRYRIYAGPSLLIVAKSETTQKGTVSASYGSLPISIPISETRNLRSDDASFLKVKNITYGLEAGIGINPIRNLELDLRYAAPVGGVYKSKDITGYLGIAILTVGYKLAGF